MAKHHEDYHSVIVESYRPRSTAGLHGPIHVRPVAGQIFATDLQVECSKALVDPKRHPVGTRFKLKAKLTDRDGGGEYLYSYWGWKYEVVS